MSERSALADAPTLKTGRPRWWVAGLSLCVALVGVGVWFARDDPYRADLSEAPQAPTALAGAAAATLQDLTSALADGDPLAAADLASAEDAEAHDLLAQVADNAAALRLDDITARYVDEVGAVAPDGSWSAAVDLTWAIEGFDREAANAEVIVDFRPDGDRAAISGLGGPGRISPLWLSGPVVVRRLPDALVMAAGPRAEAQAKAYLQRARRAIPVVRRVLPDWRPSVVLEVPASAAQLDRALDVADGTYAGIAAVTAAADGVARPRAPVRVFVNPEVTGRLRGAGAQVVVSHELVHVATDAISAPVDSWLLEGFADYVALRDVDLPVSVTAARAAAVVRRDGVPRRLPGATDFATTSADLEATYELAWLACVELAALAGEDGLVQVYQRASAGTPTAQALASVGVSVDEVVSGWQRRLRGLA